MKKIIKFLSISLLGLILIGTNVKAVSELSLYSHGQSISSSQNNRKGNINVICPQNYTAVIQGISKKNVRTNLNGITDTSVYDGEMKPGIAWVGAHIHE